MDLILWRHAEAVEAQHPDEDMTRALTVRGDKQAMRMAAWLDRDGAEVPLADLCATLAHGRVHLAQRAAFVVRDIGQLRAALRNPAGAPSGLPRAAMALREAYLSGGGVDWTALYPAGSFRRRRLPTYPFERRRCWPVAEPADPPPPSDRSGPVSLFDAVIRDLGVSR